MLWVILGQRKNKQGRKWAANGRNRIKQDQE